MSEDIKSRMNISEFQELGYLQEVNRRFFHPLGLALQIIQEDDGAKRFGGVWDCRNEPDGIIFGFEYLDEERKAIFRHKKEFIEKELKKRKAARERLLGAIIEAVD
jgi:hypothetical protein